MKVGQKLEQEEEEEEEQADDGGSLLTRDPKLNASRRC